MPPIPRKNQPEKTPYVDSPALPADTRPGSRPESANTRETPPKYNRLADVPGLREAFDEIQAQYRTDEIIALNDEILESLRTSLEKAIEAGRLLTIQKAKLKHGEWLPYISTLPFDQKTAWNYMKVFEHREKLGTIPSLTDAYRLIADQRAAKRSPEPKDVKGEDSREETAGDDYQDNETPQLRIVGNDDDSPTDGEDSPSEQADSPSTSNPKPPVERKIPPVEIHFPDDERRALFETKLRSLVEDGCWGETPAEVLARGLYELEKYNPTRETKLGDELLNGPNLSGAQPGTRRMGQLAPRKVHRKRHVRFRNQRRGG